MSLELEGDQWVLKLPAGKSGDLKLEESLLGFYEEKFEIMSQRHKKYGPGNIAASGRDGILVRQRDKLARLLHTRLAFDDETVLETLIDYANYGDILGLWEQGLWPKGEEDEPRRCSSCGSRLSPPG